MKVLWFTNTPCLASEKLGIVTLGGGWLKALEKEISKNPEIELSICFYSDYKLEPFEYNNTHYYPVLKIIKKAKMARYLERFTGNNSDEEEVQELLKIVKSVNPDVIHIHGSELNFGLIQEYIKTPVVLSIQGLLTPYAEKFYSGIPASIMSLNDTIKDRIRLNTSVEVFRQFKRNALREARILKNTKYVVGRTDWDRRAVAILAPCSSYFTGNEILRQIFYEKVWKKNSFGERIQIVTIMNGAPYKGFETIVNTASILSERMGFKFIWKVIGIERSSKIVKTVEKWKKVDSNDINIGIIGQKNEEEVLRVLLESDIYCQVSHIENSPNSLAEAMLIGMPIIATFAGGTDSLLENKKEGLLLQEGEYYSIAGAIVELSNNFNQSVKFGIQARERALIRHKKESIAKNMVDIYNKILENKK
jgi:glycosyltransferase involved in cell wall biosynthesis